MFVFGPHLCFEFLAEDVRCPVLFLRHIGLIRLRQGVFVTG